MDFVGERGPAPHVSFGDLGCNGRSQQGTRLGPRQYWQIPTSCRQMPLPPPESLAGICAVWAFFGFGEDVMQALVLLEKNHRCTDVSKVSFY